MFRPHAPHIFHIVSAFLHMFSTLTAQLFHMCCTAVSDVLTGCSACVAQLFHICCTAVPHFSTLATFPQYRFRIFVHFVPTSFSHVFNLSKYFPPAPRCGDSDYTRVSGWYPAATELIILKKVYASQNSSLVFMLF